MSSSRPGGDAPPAGRSLRVLYAVLLAAGCAALAAHPELRALSAHPIALGALLAISACGYLVTHRLLALTGRIFDMTAALGLVAVVLAGPLGFVVVSVVPDLIHLVRRRRGFMNLGLVANLTAWTGEAAVAAAVLTLSHGAGLGERIVILLLAGMATLVVNYVLARLLLAAVRDHEKPVALVRREFLATLPLESLAVAIGVLCALLLPAMGVPVFSAFISIAYVPQLVAARLLRAPSVAVLTVDDAAAVYRDALADELGLARADRRLVHLVDAIVERRPAAGRPPAAIQDALFVTMCIERSPTQRHFSATARAQVVLVARGWARLTARCTPALNHREALLELSRSGLAHDAPLALAAAGKIIEREDALTEHVAGVPRLHRAPLPRTLRHDVLPVALERLAA